MKIIGLTGGIGSGKTTVANMFEQYGIPVYFSDDRAKKIMSTSLKVRKKLIEEFGKEAFLNNELNRKFIADIVFHDMEKLSMINSIVHPEVRDDFESWLKLQNSPYVIQEHPLIFENKKEKEFHAIVLVTAPVETRIARIVNRDHASIRNIEARMNNQLNDDVKIENSDYVINNIDLDSSQSQVKTIHKQLLFR